MGVYVKYKPDDSGHWCKEQLVAKGAAQIYGVSYREIFALVAKMTPLKAFISIAIKLN